MFDSVRSTYWWEDNIQEDEEVLLVCKSERACYSGIENTVKKHHSYSVPEVIALPIVEGSQDYLGWVTKETRTAIGDET
jgi:periplasmic divalent cation tolerance protein